MTLDEQTGKITTVETGTIDTTTTIRVEYKKQNVNIPMFDDINITIKRRVYPSSLVLNGPNRIENETTNYS
jgi:hypothetical protein